MLNSDGPPEAEPMRWREVILGRHSKVWRVLSRRSEVVRRFEHTIGHRELGSFQFTPNDRVWVFAYSKNPAENASLVSHLQAVKVGEIVYVSSASTVVSRYTNCYRYPRVKLRAEADAKRRLNAQVLNLGLVYEGIQELPAGRNAATSIDDLAQFLLHPVWPEDRAGVNLFDIVERPFSGTIEAVLYQGYGAVIWACRRWPCVLRPIDMMLRVLGFRWYGYVHLSNRLWTTTTS